MTTDHICKIDDRIIYAIATDGCGNVSLWKPNDDGDGFTVVATRALTSADEPEEEFLEAVTEMLAPEIEPGA